VPVLFDGGVRRGVHVLKALALGATAVFVGRPLVCAVCSPTPHNLITLCVRDALRGKPCNGRAKLTGESLQAKTKTQRVEMSLLTLQNPHAHTRTNTNARTLTSQHGRHRQRRRNYATELCSC
jgi:hypothetical protein